MDDAEMPSADRAFWPQNPRLAAHRTILHKTGEQNPTDGRLCQPERSMTAAPTTNTTGTASGSAAVSGARQRRRGSGLSASLRTIFRRSSFSGNKQKTSFLDAFPNHSHHSDGTANTTTLSVSSSLNANNNNGAGSGPASSIEYVARAPFPYRPVQPAQPAQDVPAQTQVPEPTRGQEECLLNQKEAAAGTEGPPSTSPTCTRSTTTATAAKEEEKRETEIPTQDVPAAPAAMPRRPSLKKTHDQPLPRLPAQEPARGRRPAEQRPRSASLPTSLDETWRGHSQEYDRDQHRRKSVQFDDRVSYALISPALRLVHDENNDNVIEDTEAINELYYTRRVCFHEGCGPDRRQADPQTSPPGRGPTDTGGRRYK